MADLIDRQELLDALHERLRNPKKPEQSAGIAAAERIAQNMPTVGPKRGVWLEVNADEMYGSGSYEPVCYFCSECRLDIDVIEAQYYGFCPYCGADMRGVTE